MPFDTTSQDTAINAVNALVTHIGLLDSGGTEVTGGSPAYSRLTVAWNAASGSGLTDNTAIKTFDVPAVTVGFISGHTAITAGSKRFDWPVQGDLTVAQRKPKMAYCTASADTITSQAHGLTTNDRVVFYQLDGLGVPAGLTSGTIYYVIATGLTADVFEVSTTLGGGAVNITADGSVWVVRAKPEVFASQGQFQVAAGDLDLVSTLLT